MPYRLVKQWAEPESPISKEKSHLAALRGGQVRGEVDPSNGFSDRVAESGVLAPRE
jgi:hypothetical protein